MLFLNKVLVFLCAAFVVLSYTPIEHELAKTYDVVLRDNSTMTPKGHAEWANFIHMRSLKSAKLRKVDKMLGAGEWKKTGPNSYRITVNNYTMGVIKNERNVLSVEPVTVWKPTPNDYAVRLRKGVRSALNATVWANDVHLQIQGNDTNDQYEGIIKPGFLSKGRWCFVGSFSNETLAEIRKHPQVDSVGLWKGGLDC